MSISRRSVIKAAGATVAATAVGASPVAAGVRVITRDREQQQGESVKLDLKFAVKYYMVKEDLPLAGKMSLLRELGFDGFELDSPNGFNPDEVIAAREKSGLPIHGVVDSVHWNDRLSSPDAAQRAKGLAALKTAIRDSKAYGGSSVLLVPGRVTGPDESHQHVWDRSIAAIREALPLAAELGIHILIENVWNGFCYEHDGPADQTAETFAAYIDAINSPWVGAYLDLGNHQKYGSVPAWIRTLGKRIVKLDVKDWGVANGWARIGDGDVDWSGVREALAEIGYTGWCTAEVGAGDAQHLREVKQRMDRVLRNR